MVKGEVKNESFVFHANFIKTLPQELTAEWSSYIINYGLCGIEPDFKDAMAREVFLRIKERIDADQKAYELKIEKQREAKRKYLEKKSAENIKNIKNIKNIPNDSPIYEFKSDSEFKSEFEFKHKFKSNTDVCDKRGYFLSLWNKNADVLGIAQAIERPHDFDAYFDNESVTKETIEKGITHFVEAVKSGKLQKRFIPATPDRFVLKNTLERFQEPMTDKNKSVIYDADHRGEFQEVEQA